LVWFWILPQISEIKKNSKNLLLDRENLILLQQKRESLEKFKQNYSLYRQNFEKLEKLLIDKETPIDFIEFLEESAKSFNLFLEIEPAKIEREKTDPWDFAAFKISLLGSFSRFLGFLERLENSDYLIEISSLQLKRIGKDDLLKPRYRDLSVGNIDGQLLIKVFAK